MSTQLANIGVVGAAVMAQNIMLNMADKGYTVCAYNRTTSKVDDFLNNEAKGKFTWFSLYLYLYSFTLMFCFFSKC